MAVIFPYGKKTLELELPAGARFREIIYNAGAAEGCAGCMVRALQEPIGSLGLAKIAQGRRSVVILISDRSRLAPSHLFLPLLLAELNQAGIADERIKVIVALGFHRRHSEEELKELVGAEAYGRVKVLNHSCLSEDCVRVGITSQGTPIEINRHVVEAELRILTGNIEPHALVGVSGGVKALVPGVASRVTIEANHALSKKESAQVGQPDNLVHRDLEESLTFLKVDFLFNVVVNHRGEIIEAVAGAVRDAHQEGIRRVLRRFMVPVEDKCDFVIASAGGYPKDQQLYQAIKALRNAAAFAKPGAPILLAAQCKEYYGNPVLQEWIENRGDRGQSLAELKNKFVLGAHKMEHIDEVIQQHPVWLYSEMPSSAVELCGFHPVENLQKCLDVLAGNTLSSGGLIGIMPYAGLTFAETS